MADKSTISELLQSADTLLKSQRYSEALPLLQSILTLDPNNEEALKAIGVTFAELKKYNDAIIAYNRALKFNQNNSSIWNGKGEALFNLAIYQEALDAFDKAILLNPNFEDAWTSKGASLSKLGRHEEALDACDKAISIGSTDGIAWINKGFALTSLGRHEEALNAYNEAISVNPNNALAWNQNGVSLYNLGRYQEAFTAFDKSLEINPDYATAKTNRNNALEKIGLIDKGGKNKKLGKSTNPIWKSNNAGVPKALGTIAAWIIFGLSAIATLIIGISINHANGTFLDVGSFLVVYFIIAIFLFIIYWVIPKVYPQSRNWGVIKWVIALMVIPIIIILVLAFGAGFIFGVAGSGSNYQWVQYSNYGISFNYPSSIPVNTSTESYSTLTNYKGELIFDNPDSQEIDIIWISTGTALSQDVIQKVFTDMSTLDQKKAPDLTMSSIQQTVTAQNGYTVYYANAEGHDMALDGRMAYDVIAMWRDPSSQRDFILYIVSYKSQDDAQSIFNGIVNSIDCNGGQASYNLQTGQSLLLSPPQPTPTSSESNLANAGSGSQLLQTTPTESLAQLVQEANQEKEVTEAQKISQAIDYLNPTVHNFALQQVQRSSSGAYTLSQICDVWQSIYNQWVYVSDPPNFDYWTSASDSITNGLKGNCADYAILNAAVIESISGTSRVVTTCAPGGSPCHAYAEVLLWQSSTDTQSKLQDDANYISSRYGNKNINYHITTLPNGNTQYWLNLDWQANYPGGPYFKDDGTMQITYPNGIYVMSTG